MGLGTVTLLSNIQDYRAPKKFVVTTLVVPTLSMANLLHNSFRLTICAVVTTNVPEACHALLNKLGVAYAPLPKACFFRLGIRPNGKNTP